MLLLVAISCKKEAIKVIPTITTSAVTNITATSATCGGEIKSDGGALVTSRGFCWSITQNPNITDNKTTDGEGVGSFTSNMARLTPNTAYYIRAYATNIAGTGFGNEIEFKTFESGIGTVTDIDGYVYHTVTIDGLVWMVENLKVTKYNDGSLIPNVTDNQKWSELRTAGYCWYNNDISNRDIYGALYNIYAVNKAIICPAGWRVATDTDWQRLAKISGGGFGNNEGGRLKEVGTSHWQSPNSGATNETGFTALPGGTRGATTGTFYNLGAISVWWSITNDMEGIESNWTFNLKFNDQTTTRDTHNWRTGLSVRCVKNQ